MSNISTVKRPYSENTVFSNFLGDVDALQAGNGSVENVLPAVRFLVKTLPGIEDPLYAAHVREICRTALMALRQASVGMPAAAQATLLRSVDQIGTMPGLHRAGDVRVRQASLA